MALSNRGKRSGVPSEGFKFSDGIELDHELHGCSDNATWVSVPPKIPRPTSRLIPRSIANLGYKFWIIWAVICFSFIPTTYLFYPETANRSLEDIDRFFYDNQKILVFNNKIATQLQRPAIYEEADNEVRARNEKLEEDKALAVTELEERKQ